MLYLRIAPSLAYGWITRPSTPFNPDNRHGNAAALCYKLNEPSLINAQLELPMVSHSLTGGAKTLRAT